MYRRMFLAVVAGASLAGCAGGGPSSETTPVSTPTPAPTPTETPGQTTTEPSTPVKPRPDVRFVNLVSKWEQFGDAVENQISEVAIGDTANIAFRHYTMVHDGTFHVTEQVEVFGPEGKRVAIDQFEDEQLYDLNGVEEWEHYFPLDTEDWEPGRHRAEVIIRDEVTGKVSEPETTEFEVVESVG